MISSEFYFENSALPLLAFAIHNGSLMPEELQETCGIDKDARKREEDPYTEGFAQLFPNRVVLSTSRFAVDLNRSPEKAVYLKPEDAWGLQVRTAELDPELIANLELAYQEWYKLAFYQIDRMLRTHKRLLVLDLHSYNHRRGGPDAVSDPQSENPDIIIGRNNLEISRYAEAEKLHCKLDGQDFLGGKLDCRCDVKFSGGHFSRWVNRTFGDRVLCLAIEFKKIFMNEWTGELDMAAFEELKAIFYSAVFSAYKFV